MLIVRLKPLRLALRKERLHEVQLAFFVPPFIVPIFVQILEDSRVLAQLKK